MKLAEIDELIKPMLLAVLKVKIRELLLLSIITVSSIIILLLLRIVRSLELIDLVILERLGWKISNSSIDISRGPI